MASKTITLDNLVALGPERLAAILVELANDDAEIKRRLRLELAAQAGDDTSPPRSASASPPCGLHGPSSTGSSAGTS